MASGSWRWPQEAQVSTGAPRRSKPSTIAPLPQETHSRREMVAAPFITISYQNGGSEPLLKGKADTKERGHHAAEHVTLEFAQVSVDVQLHVVRPPGGHICARCAATAIVEVWSEHLQLREAAEPAPEA